MKLLDFRWSLPKTVSENTLAKVALKWTTKKNQQPGCCKTTKCLSHVLITFRQGAFIVVRTHNRQPNSEALRAMEAIIFVTLLRRLKSFPLSQISGLEGVTARLQIFAGVVQVHGWMPYPSMRFYVRSKRNMCSGILSSNSDGLFPSQDGIKKRGGKICCGCIVTG